ncbi:methylglyoxal synthase [Alkalibacterium putridalgicola]|uniref:Methylglyoxal synthase n=2 Tax=Alkalibacterium putridalgicola TaxID=426703 RepID=A0A1H7X7X0_9LACT|nr:methylglyoxal synthase [Alkalibacterium putridalgicola]
MIYSSYLWGRSSMNIALIAHDKKKDDIVKIAEAYKLILSKHDLYATGTTGKRIMDETGLDIHRFKSGPLGGDQQIGAYISDNKMDLVIFIRDPLTSQAHEPDISALLRLCDVYEIPLATNMGSAEVLLRGLDAGFYSWRDMTRGTDRDALHF